MLVRHHTNNQTTFSLHVTSGGGDEAWRSLTVFWGRPLPGNRALAVESAKPFHPFSIKNLLDYTLLKHSKMDVTLHWDADTKIINYGWLQESKLTE